ncbi:hypothetical protein C8J56DRAFT_787630, partial [Mycena floridula]
LEFFCQIFHYLNSLELFDLQSDVHCICLYIVFHPRIQASLDQTLTSWNLHKMSTEHSKTPESIYALSRTKAINRGYWSGDPGDDIETASCLNYGRDSENKLGPPMDELRNDPIAPI